MKEKPYWIDMVSSRVFLCGLAAFLFVLFLCWARPYYFLQDDNRDFMIGAIAHNFGAVSGGEIPLFNFHQFMGTPFLSTGTAMSLYPPAYIGAFLSQLFLGHIFGAVDIMTAVHFAAGAGGMYLFLCALGLGAAGAVFGALCWPFTGMSVFGGSSWPLIGPVTAYFPWMLWSVLCLARTGKVKYSLFLAAARLMLFYSGYPQMFVYACLLELAFFCSVLAVEKDRFPKREVLLYLSAYAHTFFLALPLLLPVLRQMTLSFDRSAPLTYQFFSSGGNSPLLWLWGLVFPLPVPQCADVILKATGTRHDYFARFDVFYSHIGIMAVALAGYAFVRPAKCCGGKIKYVLFALAGFCWLWTMGYLDRLFYLVPVLNRFRYHLKVTHFLNFFLVAVAAGAFSGLYERFSQKPWVNRAAAAAIAFNLGAFFLLFAVSPSRTFLVFRDKPPLKEELAQVLKDGRVVSASTPSGFQKASLSRLLSHNFATLFGVNHFAGYQVLLPEDNAAAAGGLNEDSVIRLPPEKLAAMVPYLRSWGVKWYVVPLLDIPAYYDALTAAGLESIPAGRDRGIFQDMAAFPLAYAQGGAVLSGTFFGVNSARTSVSSGSGSEVIFNVVYNPCFEGRIDGVRTVAEKTPDGKISLKVPPGAHVSEIVFRDAFFTLGVWIFFGYLAALCAGAALWVKFRPARS